MKNRKERVETIIHLITNHRISNQEQLTKMLAKRGFVATQATISRDLRMLHTKKIPTRNGHYAYVLPDSNDVNHEVLTQYPHLSATSKGGFLSLQFSQNIAIIKTRPGYASGIAYDLDMNRLPEIMGTIAGGDTVLAVLHPAITHEEAKDALRKVLPLK